MSKDIRFNRERFDRGNKYYGPKGINPQTAQLRIEMPFAVGQSSYNFDLKKAVKRITEKILQRNDLFIARAFGVALMIETDTKVGHAPLLSYPLLQSDALPSGINGLTNTDAYAVYNGELTMKTGQNVNYSRFPLAGFLHVPQTQPVVILDDSGDFQSAGLVPEFNLDNLLYELPEEVVFAGTQDHKITIDIPASSTTDIAGPDGTTAFLVLLIEGWLYEGATNEEYKRDSANPYRSAI
ncbi:MAG: hypothetical protein BGO29_04570 [Bacteroidales bacterium 36-12]|nr:MAG: hypothetical protein BGO29_04570 [Bacteroidales bacterium 36-12]